MTTNCLLLLQLIRSSVSNLLSINCPTTIDYIYRPINVRTKNMFSPDVKRLSFRCQTLKSPRPNLSLHDLKCLQMFQVSNLKFVPPKHVVLLVESMLSWFTLSLLPSQSRKIGTQWVLVSAAICIIDNIDITVHQFRSWARHLTLIAPLFRYTKVYKCGPAKLMLVGNGKVSHPGEDVLSVTLFCLLLNWGNAWPECRPFK